MEGSMNHAPNRSARPQVERVKANRMSRTIIVAIVTLVVLAFVAVYAYSNNVARTIASDKYQAVFLNGGQVYFGKLKQVNGDYVSLSSVFYIQNQNGGDSATSSTDASDIQLIKLGTEVHGPEDEMIIRTDEISFFENLKNDSKISKSIQQYKEEKKD